LGADPDLDESFCTYAIGNLSQDCLTSLRRRRGECFDFRRIMGGGITYLMVNNDGKSLGDKSFGVTLMIANYISDTNDCAGPGECIFVKINDD
jgi:hypothetical protein